jgi:hypothetical protein
MSKLREEKYNDELVNKQISQPTKSLLVTVKDKSRS